MADKYINIGTGGALAETEATASSSGASDAGKIPALDAAGKLSETMMPSGVGAAVETMVASETLAAGDVVNVWDDSGTRKARKADATNTGKPACGFVLAGVTSGETATVYFSGENSSVTGLTLGSAYYLSAATPGAVTATAPTTAGNVRQYVGRAVSATLLVVQIGDPVTRA